MIMAVDLPAREFERLVHKAIDALPAEIMRTLDNVVFHTADFDPDCPDAVGLYDGVSVTERETSYSALPDVITIFRLPLCAMWDSVDQVASEITVTLVHEIGHHFGFDEDELHQLGWG